MIINATPSSSPQTSDQNGTTTTAATASGGGGEMRGGYVGLMNCVFAAQKAVRLRFTSSFHFPAQCSIRGHGEA